jgi:hypothetical protein
MRSTTCWNSATRALAAWSDPKWGLGYLRLHFRSMHHIGWRYSAGLTKGVPIGGGSIHDRDPRPTVPWLSVVVPNYTDTRWQDRRYKGRQHHFATYACIYIYHHTETRSSWRTLASLVSRLEGLSRSTIPDRFKAGLFTRNVIA